MSLLAEQDPQVAEAISEELDRQRNSIELIASENFTSPAVMQAMGSVLTNKYAEGYPAPMPTWRRISQPSSRAMSCLA